MSNEKNLPYAVVCGGVNIDIGAHSFAPLRAKDSNPGKIELSLGGVGRNIAHNMRLLGVPTYLLTAVGGDSRASQVEESCKELASTFRTRCACPTAAPRPMSSSATATVIWPLRSPIWKFAKS